MRETQREGANEREAEGGRQRQTLPTFHPKSKLITSRVGGAAALTERRPRKTARWAAMAPLCVWGLHSPCCQVRTAAQRGASEVCLAKSARRPLEPRSGTVRRAPPASAGAGRFARAGAASAVLLSTLVSALASAIVHLLFASVSEAGTWPAFWRFVGGSAAVRRRSPKCRKHAVFFHGSSWRYGGDCDGMSQVGSFPQNTRGVGFFRK